MNEFQVRAMQAALGCVPAPARVLEWGCGHSTLYFGGKLGRDSAWDAIEHDASWSRFVSGAERPSDGASITVHHVPADAPLRHPDDDGDAESFGKYIAFPSSLDRTFGFILVDGRARVGCMREAWRMLRQEGIMALHDSEREEYLPGYPARAYRIALHAPGLKEQTRITFFLKSAPVFAAFAEALEECLPGYVERAAARPARSAQAAAST
jgi:hypothetical protein